MPKPSITSWPRSAKPKLCPDEAHRASGAGFPAGSRVSTRLEPESKPAPTPLDPIYAANPRLWVTTFLQFQPDPQQAALLDACHPYLLLNCTRQWGKTTVIAAKALHFAFFHPRTTTLVAAPSERQSLTLLRHLKSFLQILGLDPLPIPSMPLSLCLPNGSEIVALPASADTVRGFTAHLLIFDEASRVPESLYHALSPSRATTNAPLWLLSTPDGPTGFFYEAWHEPEPVPGQPDQRLWQRFSVPATDCPRIDPEFLTIERLMLGDARFRQEYLCEFTNPEGCFLTRELIESAIDPTVEPLFRSPLWSKL